jgi:hypothetical protein
VSTKQPRAPERFNVHCPALTRPRAGIVATAADDPFRTLTGVALPISKPARFPVCRENNFLKLTFYLKV